MRSILLFFSSLRLTVVSLALAMGLVFIGTLAQVKIGLYQAQEQYFQSLFLYWSPTGGDFKIPVYPGGYLLGLILLINLITAHAARFKFTRKKLGIFVIHSGLILLFIGQFATETLSIESYMAIGEGGSKNYSENSRKSELAVIDISDPVQDAVVAIPESILARQTELSHASLPFTLKIQNYNVNSQPSATDGKLSFSSAPYATKMNDRNIPSVRLEIIAKDGTKGLFEVSNWLTEENLTANIRSNLGEKVTPAAFLPPSFQVDGHTYQLTLRPTRYYKPYTMELLAFAHDRYAGTDTAKNFSSRLRLTHPQTGEDREVKIFMNNPLRYQGETYYQGGFFPGDDGTILQVVRNPSWLTPYISCILVSAGLLIQFLSHLITFLKKQKLATP